jgi:hypothetical protein
MRRRGFQQNDPPWSTAWNSVDARRLGGRLPPASAGVIDPTAPVIGAPDFSGDVDSPDALAMSDRWIPPSLDSFH